MATASLTGSTTWRSTINDGPIPLDQVSSQALSRLAAERGLTAWIEPAPESAVPKPRGTWKRWLPYLFFALSLFALGGMVLGVSNLADGGWSFADAVQIALMGLLVLGVFQQSRAMLRATPLARFAGHRPKPAASEPAALPALDAVSAEELAASRPALLPRPQLRAVARRRGGWLAERFGVAAVLCLASLALAGMLFLCGYIAYIAGPRDPALWLTAPFAALTGFGTYQLFHSARRSAFRGRPWALVQRAFRDSVRVWGSGSLVSHVFFTSAATASVAGAAIAPVVLSSNTPIDLFVVDSATAQVYRIDLATGVSSRTSAGSEQLATVGLGALGKPLKANSGKKLPKGSLLAVVEGGRGAQAVVAYRPSSREPVAVARIDPPLPGATFAATPYGLFALQPDGSLVQVDLTTGAATTVLKTGEVFGPMAYDPDRKNLLVAGVGVVWRIDPRAATVSGPFETRTKVLACGVAVGSRGRVWLTDQATGQILLLDSNGADPAPLAIAGDLPPKPCALALAPRK